jgi:hypothetical protein
MAIERQSTRKFADRILCIQIEPNNDAIVLNISDGGLGFFALSPMTHMGTIYFSYLENGQRIQASGEIVWTDSTKKTGGLSFASLPRANRERILNWVYQAGTPKTTGATPRAAIPTTSESPLSSGMPLPQSETPGFALFEDTAQHARYNSDWETGQPNSGKKFFSGFLTGGLVSGILLTILLFVYGGQSSALLNDLKARVGVSPVRQSASAEQSTTAAPSATAIQPPTANPSPQVPSGLPPSANVETPTTPAPLTASSEVSKANDAPAKNSTEPLPAIERVKPAPAATTPKVSEPGEEDLVLAQPYLNNKSGPAGNAVAVRLLWSAVEKGNVQAEITLANLYSHGNGVTKSCDQARVLLRAAAKKGSNEASQDLAEIVRTGCR